MIDVRDVIATNPALWLTAGGFLIGLVFGALVRQTNYCTMGAISDWRIAGNRGRLGAVALAAATAMIAAQVLDWLGIVELSKSIYLTPRINWVGAIFGGLLFGAGMVYAGGCPSRSLARVGGGDARALVAMFIMAFAALAALTGILGSPRVALDQASGADLRAMGYSTQALTEFVPGASAGGTTARWIALALLALPLLLFAVLSADVLSSPTNLLGGLGVGLLVAAGWALTGLAYDEMTANPFSPASLSFVKPVSDAIDWLERATALGLPGFAAAGVFGTIVGSFLASLATGTFRLTGFADKDDLVRHIGGGIAMGIGGIMAMGCTIGQGVTGLSTLSLQSILACSAIVAGAVFALGRLMRSV